MSRPALPIARRWAVVVLLLGAFTLMLAVSPVQNGTPAEASIPEAKPAAPSTSGPGAPTAAAPPSAAVNLARTACDTARVTAQTDQGVTLAYRITDEAGNVASTGTFTGSLDRTVWLSTGHDYTATLTAQAGGPQLASSAPVDLHPTCPVTVTADAPGFSDPCGTERDAVVVPRIIGVEYRVGGTVLVPGANAATGVVTVEAVARPGYLLVGSSTWTHGFTADPCLAAPEPPAPAQPLPAAVGPSAAPSPGVPPPESAAQVPSSAGPSRAAAPERDDPAVRSPSDPAAQASVGGPGPLAWGIMIAVAVAGGIVFWLKTRH
ncbi:hypothetical protein [Sinomonas sp. P10A9]|uniref:Ig-like domain-containing protein n=1 Tax=Sinomonas puerhi TaxID=3238584 RepID=A0AB39L5D9_9MICC